MPKVELEVQVWCSCGKGLCYQSEGTSGGVSVEPCEDCLQTAHNEGHDEGYTEGREDGYAEGIDRAHL